MKKFLLPLLFAFLFIAESLFVQFLPADFFGQNRILAPRFLFSSLLLLTIFVGRKQGIIYAAVFGLIFDIVYIEIIGIYFFLFPFVAYLISKIMHVLQANMIVAFFVSMIGVALLEIGVYEMDYLIHVTSLDFLDFLNLRLYSTLILNAAFLLIFIYPLKRFFEKYGGGLKGE
ncbi:rod shape-determining protein MreD [Neobacillus mesonae]|uniref:rod shape-determining protein MreD n=1 Tax=Neobacillus mesonae TaxID=1193713 RepID=UPI00203DA2C5|nr:rod shape-determining protein MreD [Neobacillus mesonae]MCM3568402.1 rod shape-determining protein MreD [Neobacillus mesonae]